MLLSNGNRPYGKRFALVTTLSSGVLLCSIAESRKVSLSVTLKHPLALNSVAHPSVRNRLKTISLFRVARNAFSPSGAHLHEYRHQFLSDVCATYSTHSALMSSLHQWRTWPCTQHMHPIPPCWISSSTMYPCHGRRSLRTDSMRDVVPRLTANTLLTNLSMSIRWNNPSLSMIQRGLGTLLSDIQSPHLEHFSIRIDLYPETSEDGDKASLSETDPPGSTSAFHTKLSRSVFDQLPGFSMPGRHSEFTGVYIAVEMREAETATMSAIKSHMITLFAPWLDRGVLRLSISPNPDGEQFVTRNPSSVHSDLGECPDSVVCKGAAAMRSVRSSV
ncbi:uncharacterized protein B0H18DRAFT_1024480 [Fomitopsis serialis]|uniref:uncharacterized protein n=1 Tax=Fomitopsis serialis TaxID=139415 RepID=UPI0020087455|nr:uncharacterized protein B0H18DRAFT_1024480 [Neoantrodia serialis]KAH9920408.1 hypothetical protein B0H18DRAFT_1024480 [Neoantrodia serialis]